jgi:uncharacterized delta-60 repeat protein
LQAKRLDAKQPTGAPKAPMPLLSVGAWQQEAAKAAAVATASSPRPAASAPEVACQEFNAWAEQYLAGQARGGGAAGVERGRQLAQARLEALGVLIKRDPERALSFAAGWRWRQELPVEVRALLEESIHGRGDLEVFCAMPLPGADYKEFEGGTMRYVTIDERTFRAYVYGRRMRQMSRHDIALHGIAVGKEIAVAEESLRVLDRDEAKATVGVGRAQAAGPCTVCGGAPLIPGQPTVGEFGSQVFSFCSDAHAVELNRSLMTAEESLPTSVTPNPFWTNPPPARVSTFGPKRVLFMRVTFPDDGTETVSEQGAIDVMNQVNDFFVEVSYNKASILFDVTPVLVVPHPKMYYAAAGSGTLGQHAAAAAKAAGYDMANYDWGIDSHVTVPGFFWGGLSGTIVDLQAVGAGIIAHELGHNYGLGHANYWESRRTALPGNPNGLPFDNDSLVGHDSIFGPGKDIEYGEEFDTMGGGGGVGPKTGSQITGIAAHFNAVLKNILNWLPDAGIITVTRNTTNRIYAHDVPSLTAGRVYALRARKDVQRDYLVSARQRINNPWLQNGVQLHWTGWRQSVGSSDMLDTTPGSGFGKDDSALVVGRTFIDHEAELYVTPVASGGSGADRWYEVVANLGPYPSNSAPVLDLSASALTVAPGQPVNLKADASDPDGDQMAFYWDFGDGTFGQNAAAITKAWSTEGEFVVRCEVSDLRGGLSSKHLVVTVGSPNTLRVSGRVMDNFALPVQRAFVHNGSLTNNDLAPDYQWTYTDSDGAFTLVGLTNGSHAVGAYAYGYVTQPRNFDSPLVLEGLDGTGVEFLATRLQQVMVEKEADADKVAITPGSFKFTRTGDTNTALRAFFLLGGNAAPKTEYVEPSNKETQTNVIMGLGGPVSLPLQFYYVDFMTGVVTTNLLISPATNAPPNTGDKSVVLDLVYPVQLIKTWLTNDGSGNTITNTNVFDVPGWWVLTVNAQDTWFQSYPDYALPAKRLAGATVTLKDSPLARPVLSIVASRPVTENPDDTGLLTITRVGRLDVAVTFSFALSGTAVAGVDYYEPPTTLTISAGQSVVNLPIVMRPNRRLDGNRTIVANLVAGTAYNLGANGATITLADNDMPRVTITAPVNVANEATLAPGVLQFTRTGDLDRPLVVNYLATGTAVSGRDFRALPGSVTIAAGQPSALVNVTPRDNRIRDGGKTVEVFVSDASTYNIGHPASATIFIADRELPFVSITTTNNATAEPTGRAEFILQRSGSVAADLFVNLAVTGDAHPLADYAAIGNRARIPAGQASILIPVVPVDDPFREDPEIVVVTVLPGTDYNVDVDHQAQVTINDNDGGFPAVGFNLLTSSGPEAGKQARMAVTVSANPAQGQDVTVDYKVIGGTAVAGIDYPTTSSTGRMVFPYNPAGGNSAYLLRTKLLAIPLNDNTNAEPNRTIVVSLFEPFPDYSNSVSTNIDVSTNDPNVMVTNIVTNLVIIVTPMNGYFDTFSTHTFTILDDDASTVTVQVDLNNPAAKEQGQQIGVFLISRSNTNGSQKVTFQMSGLAAEGADYEAVGNSVVIPPGESTVRVPIIPIDDAVQEYLEDVTITLLTAPGATLGGAKATLTILDNDGTIEFTAPAYYATEAAGATLIPVRRSGDTTFEASVDFAVTPGTAAAGIDFVATNGTLTFTNGQSLVYIPVTLLDDALVEPAKTVKLALSNGSAGGPLAGQDAAVLTIVDDDTSVEFTRPGFRVNENATNAIVTLRRSGILTNLFSVDLVVTNATGSNALATAGSDFKPGMFTINFGVGQSETNVLVRVFDDNVAEGDEIAALYLTNAVLTNSTGGISLGTNSTATLLIVDDECAFQFASAAYAVEEYARTVAVDVRRVGGTVNPVTVDFGTVAGSARSPDQYLAASGTVSFKGDAYVLRPDGSGVADLVRGETNQTVFVRIIDNNKGQGDKTFGLILSNPRALAVTLTNSAVLGSPTNTVVTILDDEVPGNVDYAFDPGLGADGRVLTVDVQPDRKVLLGGAFLSIDGVGLSRVGRLQSDGYLDSFLNPGAGPNNTVAAVVVQPDGRVLIGGDFSQVGAQNLSRIARLNSDGTVDTGFKPGVGADGAVRAIALQRVNGSDAILLGGAFSSVGGASRSHIARLHEDGSLDASFDPGGGASGGDVLAIAVQTDGKVLIGGSFTVVGGAARLYLARLDSTGSVDTAFMPGTALDGAVRSIALQTDGRILIAGAFAHVGGALRNGVARLNADGSLDASFDPGLGASGVINAVAVSTDGKVVVGGAFTNFNNYVSASGYALNRLARLNPDGSVDTGFDLQSGANDTIWTVAIQPDSAIVIGGDFTMVRGLPRSRIARVHGEDAYRINRIQFESATYQVAENAGQAVISVVRSGDVSQPASVTYATSDGTATQGEDYTTAKGTLTFAANETQKSFVVPIRDDALAEGDETVSLTLSKLPTGYVTNALLNAVLIILDNENTVAFSQDAYMVDEGAGFATITVRRSGLGADTNRVDFAVRDGSAVSGVDYWATNGTLTFGPGVSSLSFKVAIIDDTVIEPNKTALLELSNPQGGAVLGRLTNATLAIRDDDQVQFYFLNVTPVVGGSVDQKSGKFDANSEVVITPTPDLDFVLDHWEIIANNVSVISTDNPLRLVMDSDKTVTATFRPYRSSFSFEPPFAASQLGGLPWLFGGSAPWVLESAVVGPNGGRYALRSGAISDGQDSVLSLAVDTVGGAISFDYRVSSEQNWDALEFFLNGKSVGGGRSWSGETDWRSFQYTVAPGRSILTWRYSKDANFSSGYDAAFIDNIYLPTVVARFLVPRQADGQPVIRTNGAPDLRLEGKAGLTFVIQASSDVGNPANWMAISTNTLGSVAVQVLDPEATNSAARYYRAIQR